MHFTSLESLIFLSFEVLLSFEVILFYFKQNQNVEQESEYSPKPTQLNDKIGKGFKGTDSNSNFILLIS